MGESNLSEIKCPRCGRRLTYEEVYCRDTDDLEQWRCGICWYESPIIKELVDPDKKESYEAHILKLKKNYDKKLEGELNKNVIEKKLFKKRESWAIYFVPYSQVDDGISIEAEHCEDHKPVLQMDSEEFRQDLKKAREKRHEIALPSETTGNNSHRPRHDHRDRRGRMI